MSVKYEILKRLVKAVNIKKMWTGMSTEELLEERLFFGAARKKLKRKLKLYTRIAMKVADEGGRRGFLTHIKG